MDLDQLYDNFKRLINGLSPEEMQRETDRAIRESKDAYIMEGEDDGRFDQPLGTAGSAGEPQFIR